MPGIRMARQFFSPGAVVVDDTRRGYWRAHQKGAGSFTCPHCGRHYNVKRAEGARAFIDTDDSSCALTALGGIFLMLGILVALAAWAAREVTAVEPAECIPRRP